MMRISNRKLPRHGFIGFIMVWALSGCASIGDSITPVAPQISVVGTQLTGINLQEIQVTLTLLVKNPNGFALNNMGVSLAVDANQQPLFTLENRQLLQSIPAKGQSEVSVPLVFPMASLIQLVPGLLHENQLEYGVSGHVYVPMPLLGQLKIPVKTQGVLPIPQVPKLAIKHIAIESLSFNNLSLSVQLDVENPNAFGLQSMTGQYDMFVNQASAGSVKVTTGRIAAGDSGRVMLSLSVSPVLIGLSVIQSEQWQMSVKGQSVWLPDLPGAMPLIDRLDMVLDWPPSAIVP